MKFTISEVLDQSLNLALLEKKQKTHLSKTQTTRSESNFKLLIKYLTLWKKYTNYCRKVRHQKELDKRRYAKAQVYSESKFLLKCLRALKNYTKRLRLDRKKTLYINHMVRQNLIQFYYKQFRKRYLRERKRKYLKRVVRGYYRESRLQKCFHSWILIISNYNQ